MGSEDTVHQAIPDFRVRGIITRWPDEGNFRVVRPDLVDKRRVAFVDGLHVLFDQLFDRLLLAFRVRRCLLFRFSRAAHHCQAHGEDAHRFVNKSFHIPMF